jgi:hypothetical protein
VGNGDDGCDLQRPQTTGFGCLSPTLLSPSLCSSPPCTMSKGAVCIQTCSIPLAFWISRRTAIFACSMNLWDQQCDPYSSCFGGAYLFTSRIPFPFILSFLSPFSSLPFYRVRPSRVTFKLTVKFLFCALFTFMDPG